MRFSDDWLVWVHHVANLLNEIDSPAIAGSIKLGIEAKLLGNSQDRFDAAHKSILSGLKAARRVYGEQSDVPVSDRVVSLGHNSPEQQETLEKLDRLVDAVQATK